MGEMDPCIHICGDTSPILEDMADCGYTTISIDNKVDLEDAMVGHFCAHLLSSPETALTLFTWKA